MTEDRILELTLHPLQHWHGLNQRSSNWADGVAFVNQCPIASSNSFLYDFESGNQAGEYLRWISCLLISYSRARDFLVP